MWNFLQTLKRRRRERELVWEVAMRLIWGNWRWLPAQNYPKISDLIYLFVMCFAEEVDKICGEATAEILAECAAIRLFSLQKVFVDPRYCSFERRSVYFSFELLWKSALELNCASWKIWRLKLIQIKRSKIFSKKLNISQFIKFLLFPTFRIISLNKYFHIIRL